MGCCSNAQAEQSKATETNLKNRIETDKLEMRLIIKMQAVMRGFLARRKVQAVYGFRMKKGLLGKSAGVKISP